MLLCFYHQHSLVINFRNAPQWPTLARVPVVQHIYFQQKILMCITGLPNFGLLRMLVDELKANASLVPTVLGGDA